MSNPITGRDQGEIDLENARAAVEKQRRLGKAEEKACGRETITLAVIGFLLGRWLRR